MTGGPSIQDVLEGAEGEQRLEAIQDELHSFNNDNAWELNLRYHARLAAHVFSQNPGIDYKETFSPVVSYTILRLLFSLSVQ